MADATCRSALTTRALGPSPRLHAGTRVQLMEAFILGFWFLLVGFVIAAIARLWLVNAPEGGGNRPAS